MRKLPTNKTDKQKIIINATYDYFGIMTPKEKARANQIALWIMGRKARNEILPEEQKAVRQIQENIKDEVYTKGLLRNWV